MNWWVLKRPIHISWLIATVSLSLLLGVWLAQYVSGLSGLTAVWLITVSVTVILLGLWRRKLYILPLVIIGGLGFGLVRGAGSQAELSQYDSLIGSIHQLSGTVREDIDTNARGITTIRLNEITIDDRAYSGSLWVTTRSDREMLRGDRIIIEGKISSGFGSFAASVYNADVAIVERPQPGDIARIVRDWFAGGVRQVLPETEASLGLGYLLGQKRGLPPELEVALQVVGLTHIVVASGYNLTILVRLARRLFEKASKYLAALSAGTMIVGFMAITGLSPSMSRAGLVAGLSLLAWYYGRRFHPLVLLPFAAAVTVMINPSYAWGDLGWQLSFAAFAGVLILAPLLHAYFFGDSKPGFVGQVLIETFSALVVTAPLLIVSFGQLATLALVANMLVLPLVPLAMLLTFVAGIAAFIIPAWAVIIGAPAQWLLGYMIYVVHTLAGVPWATVTIELPVWTLAIMYGILILLCVYLQRVTRYDLGRVNIVE